MNRRSGWLAYWPPDRPELIMTIPRSVADVLTTHTLFEVECIDRMYLNVYVPGLQYAPGLVAYVHRQLGLPVASTAPLARITDRFSAAVHRFADTRHIPWVDFARGQRKDDVMHEYLEQFTAPEGVVFVGRAQERTPLFRTEKRRDADGKSYPWIVKTTGMVNHYYFYCVDADFGPFFLKFCSYFPYNAKLCINGHHWAQRQAARAGLGFTALDNAFAAVDDPVALQAICDRLTGPRIDALLRKWLAILPDPFTDTDRDAGYRYDLSVLQAEFSLTQMLDAPVSGRVFFEQVIRDNLDLGRPDQVTLVFDRRLMRRGPRATPGRFRTRVMTEGVTPSLHVDYKHTTIKQYHNRDAPYAPKPPSTTPAISTSGNDDTSARTAGDRLPRQPTPAARRATQPRPDHRRQRPHRRHRSGHHPHRHPRPGLAVHRPVQPRPALRTAGLPAAPERIHQQGPAHPHRRAARTRPGHGVHRANDLRPAPAQNSQPHHPDRAHPPLPSHRPRTRHREVPHLCPRPGPTHRPGELATPTTTPGRLRAAATAYRTAVDTLTATAQLAA